MQKDKIAALFKVLPTEMRMVALMSALFLCVQAGQGIGENAAFGLFLGRVDVDQLPFMYMGLGGFVSLASLAYATSLSRFRDASVVTYLLAIACFLFAGLWVAIAVFGLAVYSVLWLTTYGMGVLSGTVLWTIAGSVCDARQAKRLFPFFTSMGILGSVAGNLLTGLFAGIAGADHLIVLYAILLAVGFFLTREITRAYFHAEFTTTKNNLISDMRAGFDFVRSSQLFRLVAFSSVLYSILFFTVDFPFSEIVSDHYHGNAASLAGFKGVFTSVTTAVTFLVSLLVANRLYTRLGIIGSILIMPITYVVAFIVFFVSYSFGGSIVVRFSQLVFLGGVMGTAWNALFNVVPPERRGQVLAFNNGVPAQFGVFLSGLLIILSRQFLETKDILLLGAFVAVVSVQLTLKMRPAYGAALLNALRAGRVEVFSDQDESFSGYQNDPAAMQAIRKALHDPKAYVRRLAVEMSAKTGNQQIIPDLVDRLYDDDGSVRAAATRAVAELGGHSALGDVILGLDDPDNAVRVETLASLPRLEIDPSPELIRTLEHLLLDKDPGIQTHAAIVLLSLGENKRAQSLLTRIFKQKKIGKRRIALQSIGRIAAAIRRSIHLNAGLVLHALQDGSALIRREAARVARYVSDDAVLLELANRLGDDDPVVRQTASESLKQRWPESRDVILEQLEHTNGAVVYAALAAIPPGDTDILHSLRGYIQREVSNLRFLRSLVESFPREGRVISFLVDTLHLRESKSEERLIKAVGLFGNARAMELIRKSLNAGDSSTRASALEALETLGDRRITLEILPILDRGGVFRRADEASLQIPEAVGLLLAEEDVWLRALTVRAIPELELANSSRTLRKFRREKHPLVKQAAADALRQLNGDKMKTLNTLSTLDRILLLRDIPIFSGLSPEDLEKIADIAQEQMYLSRSIICREGEQGDELFVIVSGDVDVVRVVGGQEKILTTRGAGDFVGEMAILDSAPRSATLRALNEVRVLSIRGDAFKSILLDRPEVSVSVLQNMSARIRELNDKVSAGAGDPQRQDRR